MRAEAAVLPVVGSRSATRHGHAYGAGAATSARGGDVATGHVELRGGVAFARVAVQQAQDGLLEATETVAHAVRHRAFPRQRLVTEKLRHHLHPHPPQSQAVTLRAAAPSVTAQAAAMAS